MASDDVPEIPMVDPDDRLPTSAPRGRSRGTRAASGGGSGGRRALLTRLLPILIVVVALGGFVGLVGYYYIAAESNGGVAPLIKADQQPFRVKPDNPGGMAVPDQDKQIYDRMGRADESSVPPPNTERLLPPPEIPLPRPAAPAAPPATTASAPPPAPTPAPNSNANTGKPRTPTLSAAPPGGTPPAPMTSAPAPQPAPSSPTAVATVVTTPPAAAPARPAAPPPAPAPAPTKTAAVAPPHPATKPESSGGPVLRVAIASVRTEADARKEWERQRRMYPDALASITPSYASVDLHDKGVYWRIYVGPPEPGSEARARCDVLKRKKVDCFVARP